MKKQILGITAFAVSATVFAALPAFANTYLAAESIITFRSDDTELTAGPMGSCQIEQGEIPAVTIDSNSIDIVDSSQFLMTIYFQNLERIELQHHETITEFVESDGSIDRRVYSSDDFEVTNDWLIRTYLPNGIRRDDALRRTYSNDGYVLAPSYSSFENGRVEFLNTDELFTYQAASGDLVPNTKVETTLKVKCYTR